MPHSLERVTKVFLVAKRWAQSWYRLEKYVYEAEHQDKDDHCEEACEEIKASLRLDDVIRARLANVNVIIRRPKSAETALVLLPILLSAMVTTEGGSAASVLFS